MKVKYQILLAALVLSSLLWFSLNLNLTYEIERNVPVKINISKPYAVANRLPLDLEVKIKGRGWTLLRLFTSFSLDFNYEVKAVSNEQIVILTKPYLNDVVASGQNLTVTYVKPETLFVKVGMYTEKYVKVLPNIDVECREAYQTVGVPDLDPDSILIGGSPQVIGPLKHVYTEFRFYNKVNASISDMVQISDSLSNIIWRSHDRVSLNVKVELTAEKEFRNVEVRVPNVPQEREVLLIPQMISVQLKGGVDQLANLENSKILVTVDFNEVLSDTTGSVAPRFSLPEGIAVISSQPDKIQYVIKKKS